MGKDKEKNEAFKKAYKEQMKSKAKERKQILKTKRARLIIKNLPFTATEENLKEHFQKMGTVTSVQLLKREDGNLVGCGFVQFEAVQMAAKAKHHLNGKEFLGRMLECDFAMPKKKFEEKLHQENKQQFWLQQKIKEEPIDMEIKEEKPEPDIEESGEIEMEENEPYKTTGQCDALSKGHEEDMESDKSVVSEDDDLEASDHNEDIGTKAATKRPSFESHDITEGKTVFVKNLPFEATNHDLKECMLQFGPVYYALICVDKLTEHSRGTAFVKFRNKEDADKCLQSGTELMCLGTVLDCHPAVNRTDLQDKTKGKDSRKDSRNLYLIKEGVILAGSKAADGVSAADMAKRLQLEQYKTQMLRNLNMFLAKTRLIIHNLPPSWDDTKLRGLLKMHAGPGAVIREARVMRNLKKVDAKGIGESKEYGFVSFTTHEHALNALRSLNNNPHIFSEAKRPIVAFSIENRVMVNTKQKRLEKSRQLNPLVRQFDANAKKDRARIDNNRSQMNETVDGDYTGTRAKPGEIHKLRSRNRLNAQAQAHNEYLKSKKKSKKNTIKSLKHRKEEFIRQDGQKRNKSKQQRETRDDNFAKLVNVYKNKLLGKNPTDASRKLQSRGAWADG